MDQAVIVFAAKSPNMNLDLLDRFLLLAEEQELDIVIVINKIDKVKKGELSGGGMKMYRDAGYSVIAQVRKRKSGLCRCGLLWKTRFLYSQDLRGIGKSSLTIKLPRTGIKYGRNQRKDTAREAHHATCGADSDHREKLYRGFSGVYLSVSDAYSLGKAAVSFSGISALCACMLLQRLCAYQ